MVLLFIKHGVELLNISTEKYMLSWPFNSDSVFCGLSRAVVVKRLRVLDCLFTNVDAVRRP